MLPVTLCALFLFGVSLIGLIRENTGTLGQGEIPRVGLVTEAEGGEKDWKKILVEVESEKFEGKWTSKNEKVLLYSQHAFREGDVILFDCKLNWIQNAGNPGEFDAKKYWRSKNVSMMGFLGAEEFTLLDYRAPSSLSVFFDDIRNNLAESLDAQLPTEEASIAKALLLGDKSALSRETRESFSTAGAMHVLAISGLHVGIIMYLLFFALKQFSRWISRRTAMIISLLFIWIFVGVTGASPSVVRAALMFTVLIIGQQSGRAGSGINTLFFSAFLLLLWNPLLLFDIGFQLSYGAMLGIFLTFDRIQSLIQVRQKFLKLLWDGTALGIAAQVFTIPVVLYYFHQFPNYFWLTNLGIMIMAGVILGIGMFFFLVKAIPGINFLIALVLSWSLFLLIEFVSWVETLPAALATGFSPGLPEMILFYLAVIVLVWQLNQKWVRFAAVGIIILIVAGWQWNRSIAMQSDEIVVFNANKPVIAVKSGNSIFGMYLGENRDQADFLLKSYRSINPGNLKLEQLKNGTLKLDGNLNLEILKTDKYIRIQSGEKSWLLRTGYTKESNAMKILDMPYLPEQDGHYNLRTGAFRRPL